MNLPLNFLCGITQTTKDKVMTKPAKQHEPTPEAQPSFLGALTKIATTLMLLIDRCVTRIAQLFKLALDTLSTLLQLLINQAAWVVRIIAVGAVACQLLNSVPEGADVEVWISNVLKILVTQ